MCLHGWELVCKSEAGYIYYPFQSLLSQVTSKCSADIVTVRLVFFVTNMWSKKPYL